MNSPQNVILSIDEGTSGTRAAVVGQDGQVHCLEYHPLRVVSPRHGVVEQDANEILTMTLAVCRKTIAEAQSRNMHIQALAIATQRSTAVLWDRQSGQALVPAMVWQHRSSGGDSLPLPVGRPPYCRYPGDRSGAPGRTPDVWDHR